MATWRNIEVVSFEIATHSPGQTFQGILIDDLRLSGGEGVDLRVKDPPLATLEDEPFFPIGFYSVSNDIPEAEWQELSENGFNLVSCAEAHYFNQLVCQDGDVSKWIEFLDKAQTHGIKVAVQLSTGEWMPRNRVWWALDLNPDEVIYESLRRIGRSEEDARYGANRERNIDYLHTIVPALKDHPALYCWESLDEIAQYRIPVEGLIEGVNLLKRLDPEHPYWHNHPSSIIDPRGLYRYGHFADIVSLDIYPIPREFGYGGLANKEINCIGEYTDLLHASLVADQAGWMVLQAYRFNDNEFANIQGEGLRRFPTRDEIRFMTYQAIVHGTKGIMYFLYLREPAPPTAHTHVNAPFTPEFWDALKSLGGELTLLSPALTADRKIDVAAIEPAGCPVRCLGKQVDDELWLIGVNEGGEEVTATFRTIAPIASVEVMFEERNVLHQGDSFTDTFRGYSVHVYRLRLHRRLD